MKHTIAALVLAASALLMGCDHPSPALLAGPTPSTGSEASRFAVSPADGLLLTSGSGHTVVDGALRTFSFTARQLPDGTVQGMAHIDNRAIDEVFDVDIDCLKVVDNVAILSGVITRHTDTHAIGLTGIMGVIDAGEGHGAQEDAVTQVFFFRPETVTCGDFGPGDVAEFATPIASGNVQVHQ